MIKNENLIPRFGGGPLGLGDPDDKTLRKTEKDVIIAKMHLEEAQKRCNDTLKVFASCAKEAGVGMVFKCRSEYRRNEECLAGWLHNEQLAEEITNKYLEARSHYRRTGEPLFKYERKKKPSSGFC